MSRLQERSIVSQNNRYKVNVICGKLTEKQKSKPKKDLNQINTKNVSAQLINFRRLYLQYYTDTERRTDVSVSVNFRWALKRLIASLNVSLLKYLITQFFLLLFLILLFDYIHIIRTMFPM